MANTLTPFAAVPNDFLQNTKISIEAKGTAAFLQSLPNGFEIHPAYVRKQLGYGLRIWRRIATELIKQGTLKLIKSGKDHGSHYEFSFYNYKPKLPLCDIGKPNKKSQSQKVTVTKSDSHILSPYIKKHKITKKHETTKKEDLINNPNNNNTNKNLETCDVVGMVEKIKGKVNNITTEKATVLVIQYDNEVIEQKLLMMEKVNPKNPAGFLTDALKKDYKPTGLEKKQNVPRETKIEISEIMSYLSNEEKAELKACLRFCQRYKITERSYMGAIELCGPHWFFGAIKNMISKGKAITDHDKYLDAMIIKENPSKKTFSYYEDNNFIDTLKPSYLKNVRIQKQGEGPKCYERQENQAWFLSLNDYQREKIVKIAMEKFLPLSKILEDDKTDPLDDSYVNHHTFKDTMFYSGRQTIEREVA